MIEKKSFKNLIIGVVACSLAFLPGISSNAAAVEQKYNMSYLYFGDKSTYAAQVNQTQNSLSEISPNYFNIDENGNLKLTDAIDMKFINEMHERGIQVIPFISNHWDRELGKKALDNRVSLIEQIADAIEEYDLDGIHIDIENMTPTERDKYISFTKLLDEALPSDKIIAVAVAPNPFYTNKGWQGSYDYEELAKYCDYLMIMAYDEHYQGGSAGPVASKAFVEKSIKYALERVPKEKILLGIPFYGRYWISGESSGGMGISNAEVERLVTQYNGKVTFDSAAQSAKAIVTVRSGDVKRKAGTYTIWYENEESIKAKLALVDKYGLKGTGSWSLGQEAEGTWGYYRMWLKGYDYPDVEDHWAQENIMSMLDKEWMKGVADNVFAPNNALTRAETAAILVRALGLEKGKDVKTIFSDTSKHWAKNEIDTAAQYGLILGKGDGKFYPDDPITRQEMAVLLDRMLVNLDSEGAYKNQYKDINYENFSWSYASIVKLTDYGIFSGGTDGTFKPFNKTTRAEMATLLDRIAGYMEQTSILLAKAR